jgi:hypothetical protein
MGTLYKKNKIHLTFTSKELLFYGRGKKRERRSFSELLHDDISSIFRGLEVDEGSECSGLCGKVDKTVDIAPRQWKIICCAAAKLGMKPAELVYKVIIAPYLLEIIKEGLDGAEVRT